jgi:hypothetical protein
MVLLLWTPASPSLQDLQVTGQARFDFDPSVQESGCCAFTEIPVASTCKTAAFCAEMPKETSNSGQLGNLVMGA